MEQPDQQKFEAIIARPRRQKTPLKYRTDVSRQHSEHSTVPIGRSFKGLTKHACYLRNIAQFASLAWVWKTCCRAVFGSSSLRQVRVVSPDIFNM